MLSEPVVPDSLDYNALLALRNQSEETGESEFYSTESAIEAYSEFKNYRCFIDSVKSDNLISLYLNYYVLKTYHVTADLAKALECEVAPLKVL